MTGLEALNEFKGNNNTKLVGRAMGKQHYIDCLKTIEKHLQALEIIKEKDVDIYILRKCKTVDEYNFKIVHIVGETRELTEEELDLLKKVLE